MMRKVFSIFLSLTVLISAPVCSAGVYMQTAPNGNITYSDSPANDAVKVDVPTGNSVSSLPPPAPAAKKGTGDAKDPKAPPTPEEGSVPESPRLPYTDFNITNPIDQQTFQNQRDVSVDLQMEPSLQKNDKVQLFVDGVPYGEPQGTPHLLIQQMNRGTHVIFAVLLKGDDNTVLKKSNTITVYIHYAALGGAGG